MAADAPTLHHALVVQFVAALLQRTLGCPTVEAHQHALQGFLDDLTSWLSPVDLPTLLGQPFTLFDHLTFRPNGVEGDEDVLVALVFSGGLTRWCAAPEEWAMPRPPTQDPRPHPPALPTADTPLSPSKSQRKRDAHALQTLGVQLVALSAAQLARLDLPEALHEAVVAAQRMHAHGARTRQMQYIGKVMRQLEPTVFSSGPMDYAWGSTAAGVTSLRPRPSATDSSHTGRPGRARARRSDPTRPAGTPRPHARPGAGAARRYRPVPPGRPSPAGTHGQQHGCWQEAPSHGGCTCARESGTQSRTPDTAYPSAAAASWARYARPVSITSSEPNAHILAVELRVLLDPAKQLSEINLAVTRRQMFFVAPVAVGEPDLLATG